MSYPTAWLLKHKIMQVMAHREQWRQLTGRVEIDDAYLGGEVQGGKAGRGSPNKGPFVVAVQTTESGQPVLMCLSQRPFTKESIQAFAEKSLAAPATLVSDGLGCFTAVRGSGILHEPHVTGGGAASAKHPAFLAVNTALGNIKTSVTGTYPLALTRIDPLLLMKVDPPSSCSSPAFCVYGCRRSSAAPTARFQHIRLYAASRVRFAGLPGAARP